MKFLFALFVFFFILGTCGMAMLVWNVRKRFRAMRDAMEENMSDDAFQRMADKYYWRKHKEEGPSFDEEYFKGDPNRTARHQQKKQQQQQERRTTQTDSGVTIIDDHASDRANKKIFAQDEGEYVDYTES